MKKATDNVVMASYMKNIWGDLKKTEHSGQLPTQELYERENFYLLSKISFWSSSWLSWLQQATRFLKLRKRWQVCHTLLTKWSTNQALKNCDKTSIYEQSVSSLKAMRSTLFWTLKVNKTDAASIVVGYGRKIVILFLNLGFEFTEFW